MILSMDSAGLILDAVLPVDTCRSWKILSYNCKCGYKHNIRMS